MNEIEKLKQLTNVYRAALKEGIASEEWVQRLREKMGNYGRDFIVRESELIAEPLFLEWVASERTKKIKIGDFWEEEGKILLALHEKGVKDQVGSESILETIAYEYAVNKASGGSAFKVEDAYNALFDTMQNKDSIDRYNQFRALNDLIRALEVWLDGNKMIDIEIW
ncbi:MAG: hypothetical protein HXN77_05110 [Prevotella pallens]|uniref:hypothetical protein n=1 Tax=Prevotella pallens TaxID=60133 RepID=UPI001CB29F2B|nr:hypothetical protein [Prevotella pallens]MBF1489865.1 hypothetical protein [Prevotella pallens]